MQFSQFLLTGAAFGLGLVAMHSSAAAEEAPAPVSAATVDQQLNALPPAALGHASVPAVPRSPARGGAYLGGAVATGRVAGVYIMLARGVFLSIEQAPDVLRNKAEHWVDVQFPEVLGNGIAQAHAFLDAGPATVGIGDVVEIRFAHPQRTRLFPVPEITRVTAVIARSHERLARDLERHILAQRDAEIEAPYSIRPTQLPSWLAPEAAMSRVGDNQH